MGCGMYIVAGLLVTFSQAFDFVQSGECLHPLSLRAITFVFELVTPAIGVLIAIPIDCLFFLIFLNAPMTSAIIQGHLLELDGHLELEESKITEDEIKSRFLEYLEMHKKHNE